VAPLLYRTAPDVLIVDYRFPDEDGLSVCLRVEAEAVSPALLVHSAFADGWLTVPALIAGADGIVHKGATGRELAEAIRAVAGGRSAMPTIGP
jgi:two-component system response regulator DevR